MNRLSSWVHESIRWFANPTVSLWKYAFVAYVIAWLPSTFLEAFVYTALWLFADSPGIGLTHSNAAPSPLIMLVLVAPVIETVLVALTAAALAGVFGTPGRTSIACGMLWGTIHAVVSPTRFLGSAWAFVILSISYLAWRPKSLGHGLLAAFIPHVLGNATTYLAAAALFPAP